MERAPTLSVACLTAGFAPERTAAILELLRPLADEVVVAVNRRRAEGAVPVLAPFADRLLAYPFAEPGDRPIAWLVAQCSSAWIFNVDDDEVPSTRLLEELPRMVARGDVAHGWIPRRWLFPDLGSYLDEPPWSNEVQLRLLRNDPRFLQPSDEFHRPVVAHGPAIFAEGPLWHLDCAVRSYDVRAEKALDYERVRRGMRIDGLSHNTGLYVPELRQGLRTAPVPEPDRSLIERVVRAEPGLRAEGRALEATRADVDRHWPGPPYPASLHSARLELRGGAGPIIAGTQQTVDVLVENRSDVVWRWGREGRPEIRVGYRWHAPDGSQPGGEGLRTPLPADLGPGTSQLVPVHVVAPDESGRYRLEIDLVHEHVRWFHCGVECEVEVRPMRRIALVSVRDDVLDALALVPELEPVVLDPDGDPQPERVGIPRLPGPRRFLLAGLEHAGRPRLLAGISRRTRQLERGSAKLPLAVREFREELARCEALVVAARDWPDEAPLTRELWRVAATVRTARALGVDVVLVDGALGEVTSRIDRALVSSIRRRATVLRVDELAGALRR